MASDRRMLFSEVSEMVYAIEIQDENGNWVRCVEDDVLAVYDAREDAEENARYAFCNSDVWRVIEVES